MGAFYLIVYVGIAPSGRQMANEEKIYVDGNKSAVLMDGANVIACATLGEAQLFWDKLPEPRKSAATITSSGRVFTAAEIDRLYHRPT
jgi:hypothetical protein